MRAPPTGLALLQDLLRYEVGEVAGGRVLRGLGQFGVVAVGEARYSPQNLRRIWTVFSAMRDDIRAVPIFGTPCPNVSIVDPSGCADTITDRSARIT